MGGNYEKNIFRHLEEALAKIDFLTNEIATLKAEHKKEIDALKAENLQLKKENMAIKQENAKLREMVNKNSSNSSKPPSSDGFKRIQNSREKSGKHPGGQFGHKGHLPKLFDNPTRVVEVKIEKCKCGGKVKYTDKYAAKQLVDIEISVDVTEYREFEGNCECCGRKIQNHAPINEIITYGNNLKSFSTMLTIEGCVSINRTGQMIRELTAGTINLSEGTIAKWNQDLAICVAPAIDKIKGKLLISPVLNKDETGIRVGKTIHWFHVLGNKTHTLYCSHKKRGNEADKAMDVLPSYSGVLVHDHLKGLYEFTCGHAECNAHILRYLKAAVEGKKRKWAQEMIELLLEAKNGGDSAEIFRRYDEILEQGRQEFLQDETPNYNGDDMKLLRRMREYKAEHLRFISDENVPFDNNQTERDLRMIKAKTKISGCFRGENGGEVFAALKSYTSTLRKNGENIWRGIKSAFDFKPVFCEEG